MHLQLVIRWDLQGALAWIEMHLPHIDAEGVVVVEDTTTITIKVVAGGILEGVEETFMKGGVDSKGIKIIKSNVRTRTGFKTMILGPSKWKKAAQSYHHTLLNLRPNQCFKQTIDFHIICEQKLNYTGPPWQTPYPP